MKIAWFTPYHAHSAIGHYSQQVVTELRKKDEVIIYAPAGGPETAPRHDGGPVEAIGNGPYEALLQRLEACDVAVYNMGNHFYNHKMVHDVSIRRPGIVILHDLVLHDFFHGYYRLPRPDSEGFSRHLLYNEEPAGQPIPCVTRKGGALK